MDSNFDVITEKDKKNAALSRLRNEVSGVVTMPHPIMFDTYDISELASEGKLKIPLYSGFAPYLPCS